MNARQLRRALTAPALKYAVTGILLWFVFQAVDWRHFVDLMGAAESHWLLAATLTVVLLRFAMAWRLQRVAELFQIKPTYHDCVAMILTSSLAGFALPGGIATDAVRGYQLSSLFRQPAEALAAVLLDRVFGLFAMLVVGTIASLIVGDALPASYRYFAPIALVLLMVGLAVAARFEFIVGRLERWTALQAIQPLLQQLGRQVDLLRGQLVINRPTRQLFLQSLMIQLLRCLVYVLLFQAFSVTVPASTIFVFTPVMFILVMIPVSVGGLGVREGILLLMFSPLGVEPEKLILVGFASHLLEFLTTLPGSWYLLRGLPSQRRGSSTGSPHSRTNAAQKRS